MGSHVSGGGRGYLIAKLIWYECKPNISPTHHNICISTGFCRRGALRHKSSLAGSSPIAPTTEAYFSTSERGYSTHASYT